MKNSEIFIRRISTVGIPESADTICHLGDVAWRVVYEGNHEFTVKLRQWVSQATDAFPTIRNDIWESRQDTDAFVVAHTLEHIVVTSLMLAGELSESFNENLACTIPGTSKDGKDIAVFWLRKELPVSEDRIEEVLVQFIYFIGGAQLTMQISE
jgi:hypothetical protein